MTQIAWWLQLESTSTFERADEVRAELKAQPSLMIAWDDNSPMPDSIQAWNSNYDLLPDMRDLLDGVQLCLEDREFLIFALTRNEAYCSPTVEYHIVTKRIIAVVSGEELVERAKRLVLASEEELMDSSDSP